ncbi:MAG TPA: hypothetical protein VFH38_09700 [Jatrophihabitans sp.]|nr:hypothetical protein [Jatrophihabitans sp.]
MARRGIRWVAITAVAAAVITAAVFAGRAIWQIAVSHLSSNSCSVGDYDIDTSQASVAAAMVAEVTSYRDPLPERAAVLVLAAALQESKLTNLPPHAGDRDSVGVLQQRPSQGWGGGNAKRLTDVGEATREFLDALVKIPHWQTRPLAQAVQAVQISADGSAYAQHEPEAQALADALTGRRPAGINCSFQAPTVVAPARTVAAQARSQLGIDTPVAAGRTVRVPGAGWQTAAWFVANADRLGIDRVSYDRHVWTRTGGWQRGPASRHAVVAVMATLQG